MLNLRCVAFFLGNLLLGLAAAMLVPAGTAWYLGEGELSAFASSAGLAAAAGALVSFWFRPRQGISLSRLDGFVLVTGAWFVASFAGALPYVLTKGGDFAVNGLFEAASGFTATGASVLPDVESEAQSLLLWRALTQWLGGMGIIVLALAILPNLAVGGMELLSAEMPGPTQEKLTPRIAQTAKLLWGIYVLLTASETAILTLLGMPLFDALAHSFTTLATGGFSTRNASLGAYGGGIQWVVTVFMVLGATNFALHYRLLRGKPGQLFRDTEFRAYIAILTGAALLIGLNLLSSGVSGDFVEAIRLGAFQVVSIMTCTGFASADFDAWPGFSRALLLALMFVGGCAGSTTGSIKVVRIVLAAKVQLRAIKRLLAPNAVLPIRLGGQPVPDTIVNAVISFIALYIITFAAGGLLLLFLGVDGESAFSASATCLGTIGPGLGEVGPARTFLELPTAAKLLLSLEMILGRLELYTVLIVPLLLRLRRA
ncbi:MAG TPA: TrkH family potassium uptake protein [Vicinamibacteria bacterium]